MIGLGPLDKIIHLTIYSAYIKGEKPVSIWIIAHPEHGKTANMMRYICTPKLCYISDATAYGLVQNVLPQIYSSMVNHIVFPDFLKILARDRKVSNEVFSLLNIIIEEGVTGNILTKNLMVRPRSDDKKVYAGAIICITPEEIEVRRKKLQRQGFFSRALPFTYTYAEEDMQDIHEAVKNGKTGYVSYSPVKLSLPKKEKRITLPRSLADEFDDVMQILKPSLRTYTGFRLRKQLQTLSKANALISGRSKVNMTDIFEIKALTLFFFNPLKGDECSWKIIKNLPNSAKILQKKLQNYSKKTIYNHLNSLKEMGLIDKNKTTGLWEMVV